MEKENSVAVKGRGVFKIKRHVDDVDVAIREGSLKTVTREKRRIPRR